MKNLLTKFLALALIATMIAGTTPVLAATQEVQGSGNQTKTVPVTASISSMYSVSLPAQISLIYGYGSDDEGNMVEGYWYNLQYSVAGKLTSVESVYVEAAFPCTLTDAGTGESIEINMLSKTDCKEEWAYDEVGSCSYDGSDLSNCNYSYCCSDGHVIGVRAEEVSSGMFTGNLTFHFGIR